MTWSIPSSTMVRVFHNEMPPVSIPPSYLVNFNSRDLQSGRRPVRVAIPPSRPSQFSLRRHRPTARAMRCHVAIPPTQPGQFQHAQRLYGLQLGAPPAVAIPPSLTGQIQLYMFNIGAAMPVKSQSHHFDLVNSNPAKVNAFLDRRGILSQSHQSDPVNSNQCVEKERTSWSKCCHNLTVPTGSIPTCRTTAPSLALICESQSRRPTWLVPTNSNPTITKTYYNPSQSHRPGQLQEIT